MFNEAHVSLVGFVASEPSFTKVGLNKIPKLAMRVSWTNRRRDSASGEWIDGNTSFVNVICWRQLAENLSTCLRRGDPVVVRGRLDVRTFTGRDGQRKTAVDVDASALGPDLNRGVADFRRVWPPSGKTAEQLAAEAEANGHGTPSGEAALGDADDEAVQGAQSPAGGDIFDEGAIEALETETQTETETETATAPF
jgi:single-strand DNA-binding protein